MTHPMHFDNSQSDDYFGFDENGDQYRFDSFIKAKAWADEDSANRVAMARETKVTYRTYQHLYCGTCGKVAPVENAAQRICLECVRRKLATS
jgi:hypothetical protein